MASDTSVGKAQLIIPYEFQDLNLLRTALTAGDTNSDDREGNRRLAQVGDTLMSLVIKTHGFQSGLSRRELEDNRAKLTSKAICSVQAEGLGLAPLVKISERQQHDGPQPTTLKNALAAIVAAVWLDSQMQFRAAAETMAFLGLVNGAGSSVGEQESSGTTWIPASGSEDDACEANVANADMLRNLDAFLDNDNLLGTEWAQLSSDPANYGLHAAGIPNDSNGTLVLDACAIGPVTGMTSLDASLATTSINVGHPPPDIHPTFETLTTVDLGLGTEVCHRDHPCIGENSGASQPQGSVEGISSGLYETKRRKRTKRNDIRLAFKAYLTRETQKLKTKPELVSQHYGYMHPYQEALSSINTSSHKALATMTLAIGGCSAMQALKQAIESIRSPSSEGSFHVKQEMSCKERLGVIQNLELRMANLRIARWLHIHKLYEDLSGDVGAKDADGFIILTSEDLNPGLTETRMPAQKGNPRNLEQATITKRMMEHLDTEGKTDKKFVRFMTRLRRVGHRLRLLVNRWDIGVLCLLGPGITDDVMLSVTDAPFAEFLDIVDRFEGPKIHAVSKAAGAAVRLFMDDSTSSARIHLEDVEQEALGQLPRLSSVMQELFDPSTVA